MPVYLAESALNFWVLKNLDNPTASYTSIELNNLRKSAQEKEETKKPNVVGNDTDYGIVSSVLLQPGSVS